MAKNKSSQGFSKVLILIIAAVVLAGMVGFLVIRKPSDSRTPSASMERINSTTTETPLQEGDIKDTFANIVGRGDNLECDWKLPAEGGQDPFGVGKLYTTGNKGRSSFSGGATGINIEGHAIYKDNEVYSWVVLPEVTSGFKFDQAELEAMNTEMTEEQKQQAQQLRNKMIFNCKPWTPDESKFVLPAGIEFK